MCVCVRACVCARVRACVCACVRRRSRAHDNKQNGHLLEFDYERKLVPCNIMIFDAMLATEEKDI